MRIEKADGSSEKGWYIGPWNSVLAISVGYANVGIDEPHIHTEITEVYLVAHGFSVMRIGQETVRLAAGDIVVVEPGEVHTFVESSPDYFHFVIHTPGLTGEQARNEKQHVPRSDLGL